MADVKYRAIEAFARGLMSALLRDGEQETRKEARPNVIKTADIDAAVQRYIDAALQQQEPPPPDAYEPPEQTELDLGGGFVPRDMADVVRDVRGDMQDLDRRMNPTPGVTQAAEEESRTYDANMPGEGTTWTQRS